MCRLFGLHAGTAVPATFWLLDAPDSLAAQSHRDPDGTGIGTFAPDGSPVVDKQPIAAWADRAFATEARELTGTTFVAHVRYASTGEHTLVNTHPFTQDGRIFAHNGVLGDLETLDRRLAELGVTDLVAGQTDSERMFALLTAEIRERGGDVDAGLERGLTWIAEQLPVYSMNFVLAVPDRMWVLRYPDTHELHVLRRDAGGHRGGAALHAHSRRIHAESAALGGQGSVVVASEVMDDDPGWRALQPGELLRIDPDLSVSSSHPLPAAPRHPLRLADLEPAAAASQHPGPPGAG